MHDSKLFSEGKLRFSKFCLLLYHRKCEITFGSRAFHSIQRNLVECMCVCVQAFVQPSNRKQRQQLHFQKKRLAQSVSHSPNSIAIINTLAAEHKENPTHFDQKIEKGRIQCACSRPQLGLNSRHRSERANIRIWKTIRKQMINDKHFLPSNIDANATIVATTTFDPFSNRKNQRRSSMYANMISI